MWVTYQCLASLDIFTNGVLTKAVCEDELTHKHRRPSSRTQAKARSSSWSPSPSRSQSTPSFSPTLFIFLNPITLISISLAWPPDSSYASFKAQPVYSLLSYLRKSSNSAPWRQHVINLLQLFEFSSLDPALAPNPTTPIPLLQREALYSMSKSHRCRRTSEDKFDPRGGWGGRFMRSRKLR
jgi:hypothetical protein